MANRERGELALTTKEGREFTLRLTTNSAARLEQDSGKSWEEWGALWSQKHWMTAFRWMVWAAVQAIHGAEIRTPEAAGDLIDTCDQASLMGVMTSFLLLQSEEFKRLVAKGLIESSKNGSRSDPPTAQMEAAGVGSVSTPASSV